MRSSRRAPAAPRRSAVALAAGAAAVLGAVVFVTTRASAAPRTNPPRPGGPHTIPLRGLASAPFPGQVLDALACVPSGFDVSRAWTLILYFRGIRDTVEAAFARYGLAASLERVNPQAVLVLPELARGSDSVSAGRLAAPGGVAAFVREVAGVLGLPPPADLVVVAHSGGYEGAAQVILQAPVSQTYLLDALYGQEPAFANFVARVAHGAARRFFLATTPPGAQSGTAPHAATLRAEARKLGVELPAPVRDLPRPPWPAIFLVEGPTAHVDMPGAMFEPILRASFG